MPSFDVVSEVDMHEAANAVDQASREIGTRFDFKGVQASFELQGNQITLTAEAEFQIQQMLDILNNKLARRGIDLAALKTGEIELSGKKAELQATLQQGIEADTARRMVKQIKELKMKVQAAIQGDQVRVSGKKRDDLQRAIAALRETDWGLPLQFKNFRD